MKTIGALLTTIVKTKAENNAATTKIPVNAQAR
jgi:hypothetical protein